MAKKNNSNKAKNVFKVAGSRSLKAKKAKPVQGNLKKIKKNMEKKMQQVDEQLSQIQDTIRQGKPVDNKNSGTTKFVPLKRNAVNTSQAFEKFEDLKMS